MFRILDRILGPKAAEAPAAAGAAQVARYAFAIGSSEQINVALDLSRVRLVPSESLPVRDPAFLN
jgi:hypothetical protein